MTTTSPQSTEQSSATVTRLWHAAANEAERTKALAREQFRTACGLTYKAGVARKVRQLTPMQPCVICRALVGGAA